MAEQKHFIKQLIEGTRQLGAGSTGALIGLLLGILFMTFGFWKTFFILILTLAGYFIGVRYFSDKESFRQLLDKVFPPGLFR